MQNAAHEAAQEHTFQPPESTDQLPSGYKTTLFALWLGQFLAPFFMSGMITMLPQMAREWGSTAVEQAMAILAYIVSQAIFNILGGRLGDIWGRKRVLVIGTCIFTIASVCMGFAPNMNVVIVLRFVQGLGGALTSCCALAIAMELAPKGYRGRVMGLMSSAVYLGLSLGPFVGGAVATFLGWRWLFYGVIIPGTLVAVTILINLRQEWRESKGEPLDWLGAVQLFIGLSLLAGGAVEIPQNALAAWVALAGLLILGSFLWHQWRAPYPIFDVRMLRTPGFRVGLVAMFMNFGSTSGLIFFFPMYLQQVRMLTPFHASLFMLVQSGVQFLASPVGGRLSDRYGADPVAACGMILCGIAILGATSLGLDTPLAWMLVVQIFVGIGIGLFSAPNTVATLSNVESKHLAVASGLTGSMRTLGNLFSQVLIGLIIAHWMGDAAITPGTTGAFLFSMRVGLVLFATMNLIGLVLGLRRVWSMWKSKKY